MPCPVDRPGQGRLLLQSQAAPGTRPGQAGLEPPALPASEGGQEDEVDARCQQAGEEHGAGRRVDLDLPAALRPDLDHPLGGADVEAIDGDEWAGVLKRG